MHTNFVNSHGLCQYPEDMKTGGRISWDILGYLIPKILALDILDSYTYSELQPIQVTTATTRSVRQA